jgi:hypothetical protein
MEKWIYRILGLLGVGFCSFLAIKNYNGCSHCRPIYDASPALQGVVERANPLVGRGPRFYVRIAGFDQLVDVRPPRHILNACRPEGSDVSKCLGKDVFVFVPNDSGCGPIAADSQKNFPEEAYCSRDVAKLFSIALILALFSAFADYRARQDEEERRRIA